MHKCQLVLDTGSASLISMHQSCLPDCGQPSALGYDLGNIGTTTYLSTVQVTSCATGYTGTLGSSEIQCQSNGQWSVPEGCAAVGKIP